jgi:hypothetical protein
MSFGKKNSCDTACFGKGLNSPLDERSDVDHHLAPFDLAEWIRCTLDWTRPSRVRWSFIVFNTRNIFDEILAESGADYNEA